MSVSVLDLPYLKSRTDRIPPALRDRFFVPVRRGQRERTSAELDSGKVLPALRGRLFGSLRLPRLAASDAVVNEAQILRAYQDDLSATAVILRDVSSCVEEAVRGSVSCVVEGAAEETLLRVAERQWGKLQDQLPELTVPSDEFFDLNAVSAAALAPMELFEVLQRDILCRLHRSLESAVAHFSALVGRGFAGLLTWTSRERRLAWYFYHLHGLEGAAKTQMIERTRPDHDKVPVLEKYRKTCVEATRFIEWHRHDIYDARVWSAAAYPKAYPARVARFLDRAPVWIAEQLEVVDGDIMRETIVRQDLGSEAYEEEELVGRERLYSPALVWGPFVLVGWSGKDLGEGKVRYAERQVKR